MVGGIQKTLTNDRYVRYLRYLTRQLLRHIEDLVDLLHVGRTDELEIFVQDHNLLFGKVSLMDAFLQLADFLLELNQLPKGGEVKVVERNNSDFLRSTFLRCKELSLRKQKLGLKIELNIKNSPDHTKLTKKEKNIAYIKTHYKS